MSSATLGRGGAAQVRFVPNVLALSYKCAHASGLFISAKPLMKPGYIKRHS
jgi:hypothetical protein